MCQCVSIDYVGCVIHKDPGGKAAWQRLESFLFSECNQTKSKSTPCTLWGYSIIGSGSGFTVNLGSDSLGKLNDFRRV